MDPRNYQILALSTFIIVGKTWLGFDFSLSVALLIISTAPLTQNFVIGDPLAIAVHQLQNGALVVYAFFMITDPRPPPLRHKVVCYMGRSQRY